MTVSVPAAPARSGFLPARWTTYRLVVVLLVALAAWSFVLSFTGALLYTPAELGATLLTAVVSTLVASRVCGLLLRTRPQTDSSLITGLLLFFLFWPTTEGAGLGTVALAAAVATASKYVLVWRRRHIFNPAALGAAVIALSGLGGAVWWVATPLMLVVSLPAALLVLWRVRLLPMAAVFAVVAVAVITARFTMAGFAPLEAVETVFTSYPLVFLAGFMLTEPLTLPPLRSQRLVLAAVVGFLFAVPFSVGPVSLSPELALLIGNALAFGLGQRGAVRLRMKYRRELTPTVREVVFDPVRPVRFRAGQYMELTVPHFEPDQRGSRRTFSMATPPQEHSVAFALRETVPLSSFKKALLSLRPGTEITGTLVAGDFTLPRNPNRSVLMIASGVGITPFLSMLRDSGARGRNIVLVYAVPAVEELAYAAELQELDVRVLVCAPTDPGIPGWTWLGPHLPDGGELLRVVPDAAARAAYAAGSPAAVAAARRAVRKAGGRRVRTDPFLGY